MKALLCSFLIFFSCISLHLNAQSPLIIPVNGNGYTVTGFYTANPPKIDAVIDEKEWGQYAKYNGQEFPMNNSIRQRINIFDNGHIASDHFLLNVKEGYFNDVSASFGTLWDTSYLYFAVRVYDPVLNGNKDLFSIKSGITIYLNNGNGRGYAKDVKDNWPRKYNPKRDMQLEMTHVPPINQTLLYPSKLEVNNRGIMLKNEDYNFAVKRIEGGYVYEGKIAWKRINVEFLDKDDSSSYSSPAFMPSKIRKQLGLDLAVNISNEKGDSLVAQLMWNQCCYNTNWLQSAYFGYLKLEGGICPEKINITANPLKISKENQVIQLKAITKPAKAEPEFKWSMSGNDRNNYLAIIDSSLKLIPIQNGLITITCRSMCNIDTLIYDKVNIEIKGQKKVSSFVIKGPDTIKYFTPTYYTIDAKPKKSPQVAKWTLKGNNKYLALIDSITGTVIPTGFGNGFIEIEAKSLSDTNKVQIKRIYINVERLSGCKLLKITGGKKLIVSKSTSHQITLSGVNIEEQLKLNISFSHPYLGTITIPQELVKTKIWKSSSSGVASLKNSDLQIHKMNASFTVNISNELKLFKESSFEFFTRENFMSLSSKEECDIQ